MNIKGDKKEKLFLGKINLNKCNEEKNEIKINGQNHINLSITNQEKLKYLNNIAVVARK